MKKKWKGLSALCLAAMLGIMMPVSAMEAAEELQAQQITLISDNSSTPEIEVKYQGQNLTRSMGGTIEYSLYIGNRDQSVSISTTQGGHITSLSYYLDQTGGLTVSKSEEQLSSLWQPAGQSSHQDVPLNQDGKYVLYVKAVTDSGTSVCVRTGGMVVDTISPVITGVQAGGTYPLGTKFGVEDDNLDTVLVNEHEVLPDENGKYQVAANGTSCIIRAKDKAEHETVINITINGESGNPGGDNPQDDITVINKSGTYSLKTGTAYRLGSGSWTLEGDSVTYSGGITFYVNKDGDYSFKYR